MIINAKNVQRTEISGLSVTERVSDTVRQKEEETVPDEQTYEL